MIVGALGVAVERDAETQLRESLASMAELVG